jgi:hypothetical protein
MTAPPLLYPASDHLERFARALDDYSWVGLPAIAQAIASAVLELYPDWFADGPRPVVRDLDRAIDRDHLIEGMARWILAEMRAHPAS